MISMAALGIILGCSSVGITGITSALMWRKGKKVDKQVEENLNMANKVSKTVDKAINDISEMTPVDVRDEIVDRAIRDAVHREVGKAVDQAVREVKNDIRNEINTQVREEIRIQRDNIIDEVDRKLVNEVDKISRDDIANDVHRKVTNMIIDRMDSDLENIKERYSRKMEERFKELEKSYKRRLDGIVYNAENGYWIYKISND